MHICIRCNSVHLLFGQLICYIVNTCFAMCCINSTGAFESGLIILFCASIFVSECLFILQTDLLMCSAFCVCLRRPFRESTVIFILRIRPGDLSVLRFALSFFLPPRCLVITSLLNLARGMFNRDFCVLLIRSGALSCAYASFESVGEYMRDSLVTGWLGCNDCGSLRLSEISRCFEQVLRMCELIIIILLQIKFNRK